MKEIIHILWLALILVACNQSTVKNGNELPEEIKKTTDNVKQQYAPDGRVELFNVECSITGNSLLIKGETTSAPAKRALVDGLKDKYNIIDSLLLLPDSAALAGKTYAIVNLSVCNLHSDTDHASEMVTQGLLGMPVKVLRNTNRWYQIQTPDDYIAWVHPAGIHLVDRKEYNEWNTAGKVVVTSHYGFIYEKPDAHSQTISDVVSGNRLSLEGAERDYYKVSYPDGRKGYISQNICKPEEEWRAAVNTDAQSIIRTAYTFMGIPYLWAGTSSKGVDCSGFVRAVLYMHDIIMPRDASQQAYVGEHVDIAPDFGNLMPGDLIFFGRKATADRKERIVHVGIYIGDKKFIHSQGDVRIGSFDPTHREYDEFNLNRMLFATRFLSSINTPKINTTLTNTYYLPR